MEEPLARNIGQYTAMTRKKILDLGPMGKGPAITITGGQTRPTFGVHDISQIPAECETQGFFQNYA
jgi:hypothetical protein